jgi:excisionase family DNA binding protein
MRVLSAAEPGALAPLAAVPAKGRLPDPLLLATKEAAAMLGISRATFERLRAAGKIGPAPIRLGGRVLWKRSELEDWIGLGCPPRPEFEARRAAKANGRAV